VNEEVIDSVRIPSEASKASSFNVQKKNEEVIDDTRFYQWHGMGENGAGRNENS
jgi:hypothetical protein